MFRWIYLEIKQMLFNRKNIMLFVVLLLIHVIVLSYFSTDDDIVTNRMQEYSFVAKGLNNNCFPSDQQCIRKEQEDREYYQSLLKAISENDIAEYNKLILINKLNSVNRIERYLLNMEVPKDDSLLKEKVESYFHNFDMHQEIKKEIYQKYGYMDINTDVSVSVSLYNSKVSHLLYANEVIKEGFIQYNEPSKSNLTITLSLFRQYLMYLVIIVPVIVGFDVLLKDKKNGSIRSIMTLNQNRSKYFIVKLLSALIVSLFIIIGPLILTMLVNNVNIINDLSYPNFIYTKGLTSFDAINPVLQSRGYQEGFEYILDQYSVNSRAVFNLNEYGYIIGVHDGVTLLTLGHLLGYSIVLISLMVLLILSFQLSISLNSNEYISLLVVFLTTGILLYLSQNLSLKSVVINGEQMALHIPSLLQRINPLVYLNAVDVVEGTLPYTFLGGVLILGILSTIIIIVSCLNFMRKDILH